MKVEKALLQTDVNLVEDLVGETTSIIMYMIIEVHE